MKKFNFRIFLIAYISFILLIFISELALYKYETYQLYNLGWKISAEIVSASRFPTLIFFWKFLISNTLFFYLYWAHLLTVLFMVL